MAVLGQSATGHLYVLTVGGHNFTRHVPADTVHWSEVGGEGNAQMTFTILCPTGVLPWSTTIANNQWNFILTAPEVYLIDTSANRNLFGGNLINVVRKPMPGPGVMLECTAVSFDAWLDRRASLKWRSVENIGGVVRKIAVDQDIVQLLISKYAGFLTANNTYVKSTRTDMPIIDFDSPTVAQQLGYIAEVAATRADPTARRFYVDFYKRVHYFKGNEATAAPFRVGNADYVGRVKGAPALQELWTLQEVSGGIAYGAEGYANLTLNGSYTQGSGTGGRALPNQPQMRPTKFDGATAYGTATGANLHPGDVFTLECWFKRDGLSGGTGQVIFDGGAANDYVVGIDSTDHPFASIYGGSNWFSASETVTDSSWHHLSFTKNGATRAAYLDGVALTNGAANQTVVAGAGTVNIGRDHASTRYFKGWLNFVAIYNTAQAAGTVATNYNYGRTIVPDYIDYEDDLNAAAQAVYVRGATSDASGWVYTRANIYDQTVVIDRPHVRTLAARDAVGTTYLGREGAPVRGGKFTITDFDGWRAGQTVHVKDTNLGIDDDFEIRNIEGDANLGAGVTTYEISYGAMPWRGKFDLQRKPRMRQWALA